MFSVCGMLRISLPLTSNIVPIEFSVGKEFDATKLKLNIENTN